MKSCPPTQSLAERVATAIYFLRNGDDDDPYVVKRPTNIDNNNDNDDGSTHVRVADDCAFCTVHANEGQPMIGTAEAIAGAGKLISDLNAKYLQAVRLLSLLSDCYEVPDKPEVGPGQFVNTAWNKARAFLAAGEK